MKFMKNMMQILLGIVMVCFASGATIARADAVPSDAEINATLAFLAKNYALEAGPGNSATIVCQSGGTCSMQDSAGVWVWCSCGGGTTCGSNQRCVCACSAVGVCAYSCQDKPRAISVGGGTARD